MFKKLSVVTMLFLSGASCADPAPAATEPAKAAEPVVEICAKGASDANKDGGIIHSAFFDNENCVGFTETTFKHARFSAEEVKLAKKYKCRTVSNLIGKTEVAPVEDIRKESSSTNFPMDKDIDYMCPGLKKGGPYD